MSSIALQAKDLADGGWGMVGLGVGWQKLSIAILLVDARVIL